MSAYHKQQLKKLLGHADFGPVLGSDVFVATVTDVEAVAGHTSAGAWVLPRDTHIKGITVVADSGALVTGSLEYAVTHDGVVAASGALPAGAQSDAVFIGLDRQSAVVAASGSTLAIVYAISSDLGTEQDLRLSVSVDYLGKQ